MIEYAKKSLEGLWVGDCVGNLGQLYFAHDILKALSEGVAKFGGKEMKNRSTAFYWDIVKYRRDASDLEVTCRVCNALHYLETKFGNLPYKITYGNV